MKKSPSYHQLCLNVISELRKMLHEMAYMKHHFGSGSKDVLGLMKTFSKPIKRFISLLYKHWSHIGPFANKRVKQSIQIIIRETWRSNIPPQKRPHLKHKHWNNYAFFRLIKTFYIELGHTLNSFLQRLSINKKEKIRFSLELFLSALNPANFFPLNPEILETTWHQKGKNILRGLELWLKDANDWHGYIHYHKNEYKALHLGTDIATSQKQIVLKNEVMELLYFPCKKNVHIRLLSCRLGSINTTF